MPAKFVDVSPILPVRNIAQSLEHYERLGFHARPYADGEDYGFAERGRVSLHFTFQPTSYYREGSNVIIYLYVDDADAVYAEWSRPGVGGETQPPEERPWNMYEGVHTDPDGNVIRYGCPDTARAS